MDARILFRGENEAKEMRDMFEPTRPMTGLHIWLSRPQAQSRTRAHPRAKTTSPSDMNHSCKLVSSA
eukprot:4763039-Amphidinium_carterae.1